MTKQEQNFSDSIDDMLIAFVEFQQTKSYGYRKADSLNKYIEEKKKFMVALKEFNSGEAKYPPDTNNDCLLR